MTSESKKILGTVEFYEDDVERNLLIGAVDIPISRLREGAVLVGKSVCRVRGLACIDAVLLNRNGEKMDTILVHR